METVELDTTKQAPSPNGHDATWQTFDNDQAFLQHILSIKPAEELVEVPEWNAKVLCRALYASERIEINALAYNKETKTTNYGKFSHLVVLYGCCNPVTRNRIFKEEHKQALETQGGAIQRLAITILHLSRMLAIDADNAKKN
jgi:hypothetical protein